MKVSNMSKDKEETLVKKGPIRTTNKKVTLPVFLEYEVVKDKTNIISTSSAADKKNTQLGCLEDQHWNNTRTAHNLDIKTALKKEPIPGYLKD